MNAAQEKIVRESTIYGMIISKKKGFRVDGYGILGNHGVVVPITAKDCG